MCQVSTSLTDKLPWKITAAYLSRTSQQCLDHIGHWCVTTYNIIVHLLVMPGSYLMDKRSIMDQPVIFEFEDALTGNSP